MVGCIYFGVVISWMFTIQTAQIVQGAATIIVAYSAGIIMVTSFASGFVLFVWLLRRLHIRLDQTRALILMPAAWVVSEYARAILFSIVSYGPDGRIGPYWTFGNLGYYLVETPLRYLSRFGGLYLLSGTVLILVVAMYQSYKRRTVMPALPVLLIVAILSLLGNVGYRAPVGQIRQIGSVQYPVSIYPISLSQDAYPALRNVSNNSLDILVLPEYSGFFDETPDQDAELLQRILKPNTGAIIHSAKEKDHTSRYTHNLLRFQSGNGTVLNQQPKWFVVPAGEYVPYIYQVILAYAGQEALLRDFSNQKTVIRGDQTEQPFAIDTVHYGALACSGVVAPNFYNDLSRQGAEVLTNSAALDTMGISSLFSVESENMNKLAAVAHAKPFVQSAKGGAAYIINKDGYIMARVNSREGGTAIADVQTNNVATIYTKFGDWIVLVSGIIVVTSLFLQFYPHKNRSQH